MFVKKIKINNFKSIYGEQEFDFESLKGINCLSGGVGVGKTTICEAIIYGLYGAIDGLNIPALVSWGEKEMSVSVSLVSKGYNIDIIRNNHKQVEVYINGELLTFNNKKDAQQILENEYYDISKTIVTKLYLLTFNNFDKSICKMSAGKLREFIDEIFNIGIFTEYKNIFAQERTSIKTEISKVETSINTLNAEKETIKVKIEKLNQNNEGAINELKQKLDSTKIEFENNNKEIDSVNTKISNTKSELNTYKSQLKETNEPLNKTINNLIILYKETNKKYNNLKSGTCPTCGAKIEPQEVEDLKKYLDELVQQGKDAKQALKNIEDTQKQKISTYESEINTLSVEFNKLTKTKNTLQNNINLYKKEIQIKSKQENKLIFEEHNKELDKQINDLSSKLQDLNDQYDKIEALYNLFYSELRQKFMDSITPQVNQKVNELLHLLDMPFMTIIDNTFNIKLTNYDNEIFSYSNLSTGQKKTLDIILIIALINSFSQSEFNLLFLDELFSNMDTESRNNMLSLIYNMFNESTVFVVSHDSFDNSVISNMIKISNNNGHSIFNFY